MFPGGNAINFAVFAKMCGAESAYLGIFGNDTEGRLIKKALKEKGVETTGCRTDADGATEHCDVVLVDGDRNFVGSGWDPSKTHRTLRLCEAEIAYLQGFDLIHCGCYADMETEMKKLKGFSALCTFDFSCEKEYRTADYLEMVCPYIDMALFSAQEMTKEELDTLREQVIALGTSYVLTTNGTKGQTLYDGQREFNGRVKKVEAIDTMGAGDAFFTAFVTELVREGWTKGTKAKSESIEKAFAYAADFSAEVCLAEGAFGYGTLYR